MIREIDKEKDLPELEKWYAGHGWTQMLEEDFFPSTGFICEGLSAAWVYQTDSDLAWIAWQVTNPDVNPKAAFGALTDVYKEIEAFAKDNGIRLLMVTTEKSSLIKHATAKCGFAVGDTNMTNIWKVV